MVSSRSFGSASRSITLSKPPLSSSAETMACSAKRSRESTTLCRISTDSCSNLASAAAAFVRTRRLGSRPLPAEWESRADEEFG